MYYLAEYRKLLQSQQLLFINIAGDDAGKALDVDAVYSMFRMLGFLLFIFYLLLHSLYKSRSIFLFQHLIFEF